MKTEILSWGKPHPTHRDVIVRQGFWWPVDRPVCVELYSNGPVRKAFFTDTFEEVPPALHERLQNWYFYVTANEHDPV